MAKIPRRGKGKGLYSCFTEEELREAYDKMTIFSDAVANAFFRDKETTQHIIRTVTEQDDLVVLQVKTQKRIENILGHSVRFDVLAIDSENNYYNIEIQNASNDNLLARADFYGAAIKMRYFEKHKSYANMPRVYVIFFVKDGRFCDNKLINLYFMRDDSYRDSGVGTRIYFINGRLHDDTPIGKMSHDFSCNDAEKMKDPIIARQFTTIKQEELKEMDAFTQEVLTRGKRLGLEYGEKRGERQGRIKGKIEGKLEQLKEMTRRIMSNENKSLEDAMVYLQLSEDEKGLVRKAMT